MSLKELAKLAPGEHDLELQRLLEEDLQRSERKTRASSSPMSSRQVRAGGRAGPRGGLDETAADSATWAEDIRIAMNDIGEGERKAKDLLEQIIALETRIEKRKTDGLSVPISDATELEALYREEVKITELQKSRATDPGLLMKIELLRDCQREKENKEGTQSARNSSSRISGMDFDGPSDSPVPSSADNRHVRKMGGGGSRTSSQPPRSIADKNNDTASEVNDRSNSKSKILYTVKEEVAFKRKVEKNKPEVKDWIQGEVVRVIGEGKSRRYAVRDIDPDAVGDDNDNTYKSSASQMVPIPPEGTPLGDYEPGKQVLALYPGATTFYRAQVRSMDEGGKRVKVLFEEEFEEKSIVRRFVLDHRG
ncbi:related to SGF29 SAGA associated factor [Rhynchosporium graminicola]|uniref:Related to SGF29 SAGA associated factor n=1 Tax=Rhynchosporium graminicola TaxID=2792576 RepID=A0A1E1JR91_9HELO|nr:related to SGF29 SAGA associated factor [Rhynchosporium commune]